MILSQKKVDLDYVSDCFLKLYEESQSDDEKKEYLREAIQGNNKILDLIVLNLDKIRLSVLPDSYKTNNELFNKILNTKNIEKNYLKLGFFDDDLILSNKEALLLKIDSWHNINFFPSLYKNIKFVDKLFQKDKNFDISYFEKQAIKNLPYQVVKLILEKCPGIEKHRIEFFTSLPESIKKDIHIQKEFLNKVSDDTDLFNEFKSMYVDIKFPCLAKNLKEIVNKPIEERKSLEDNIPKTNKSKKTKM